MQNFHFSIRGICYEMFVPLNGFWPLREEKGWHVFVEYFKFGTKISLRKLWVVHVLCENSKQKEIRFNIFCACKRRTEQYILMLYTYTIIEIQFVKVCPSFLRVYSITFIILSRVRYQAFL